MDKCVTIERATAATETICALVGELEADLASHYPAEQRHGLAVDALFQPHIRFFIVTWDSVPAGCGGIALADGFAEVKRMYVRPAFRVRGIADTVVARLAAEAAANGLPVLRLETGTMQAAALRFYGRMGFTPCAAFEPYASMSAEAIAVSLFYEKRIA